MDNKSHKKYNKGNQTKKQTQPSRFLALVLRHKAQDFGLNIESSGFIKLDDIINLPQAKGYHFTSEIIKEIVSMDQKGRYQLEDRPPLYIRAVQGHSMQIVSNDATLVKISNIFKYPTVVHGTDSTAWGFIEKTGLNKMARNAIHFSIGYSQDNHVKSGMRNTCDIFIELNAIEAFYNEIPFYISVNNVILSAGIEGVIPVKYIKKVTKKDKGVIYGEKYVNVVYMESDSKRMKVFSEGKESYVFEEDVGIDDCSLLNVFGERFIQKGFAKEAFVMMVDCKGRERYEEKIKEYVESGMLVYPGLFVDYVVYDKEKDGKMNVMDYAKGMTAKEMMKVNIDWKKYYDLINGKDGNVMKIEDDDNCNNISNSISKKEEMTTGQASTYEKLTKEIIKDKSKIKHYLLIIINCSDENNNISSIQYTLINSEETINTNTDNTTINHICSFEGKTTKQALSSFLDQLKQYLTESNILNKRIVVCITKSHKELLIKSLTKHSLPIPKLFTRNQIILRDDLLNDANISFQFQQTYIQTEAQINSLEII